MTKNAIHIENLGKKYLIGKNKDSNLRNAITGWFKTQNQTEEFWALQELSVSIKKGDVIGIIGKNGAGKSTLLKLISQITKPTTGKIEIHGRIASLLEVGTGFHPELTGRENIFLNGTILGMTRAEVKSKLDEIVAFSNIEKFLETPVKNYSSGMYVRLAFAVAAHLEPEILVIDEVLAVGDIEFQKKCLGKMEEVSESGRTVLFVSHDIGAVRRLCTKCLYLNQGKKVAFGPTEEIVPLYLQGETFKESQRDLTNLTNRKGSKKAVFTHLKLRNGENLSNEFSIGDTLSVAFKINNIQPIQGAKVVVKVVDSKGVNQFYSINEDSDYPIVLHEGINNFTVDFEDIRLFPDDYQISLIVHCLSSVEVYDEIDNCLTFTVTDGGKYTIRPLPKNQAQFFMTPNWVHQK